MSACLRLRVHVSACLSLRLRVYVSTTDLYYRTVRARLLRRRAGRLVALLEHGLEDAHLLAMAL
eukprot:10873279-Alexandrium_andersonii.AAC.1